MNKRAILNMGIFLFFLFLLTGINYAYEITAQKIDIQKDEYIISLAYPRLQNLQDKETQGKFNRIIEDYLNKQMAEFKVDLQEAKESDEIHNQWGLYSDYEVKLETENLISLYIHMSPYTGGAHPNHYYFTMLYDLKNNKILTLKDLFIENADFLSVISKICIEKLKKMDLLSTEYIEDGAKPTEENYKNFCIYKDGLSIIFPPYQVAPYAAGTINVDIKYTDLKEIINNEGVLAPVLGH